MNVARFMKLTRDEHGRRRRDEEQTDEETE